MHQFWNFFLQKKAFTYIIIFALGIFGYISISAMPKEGSPEVRIAIGIVSTVLPGASSQDVEKLITNKLEDRLGTLENLDKITSVSREGVSIVTVQFKSDADIDTAIKKLKDEVDKAAPDLPEAALDPTVSEVNFADEPVLIASVTLDVESSRLATVSEEIKDELRSVPGVSKVEVTGVRAREVQVIASKDKLDQYGLSIMDLVGGLSQANAKIPVGNIVVDDVSYDINFKGDISDPETISNISLMSASGTKVYVRDVAFVSNGVEKAKTYSRLSEGGKPSEQAVTLYVYKQKGGDVTKIVKEAREKLEALTQTELLAGSTIVPIFDRGELVKKDLIKLTKTGLETVVLVVLSLLLTIGWRESLVAAMSIPLSFLMAFIGLNATGNSLNFVSLFSLILAIGILVDSGIVVTEAINARAKKYKTKKEAAYAAIKEYAWPLIAGTMTSIAAFVPLFFISGVTGKFIATIPYTVIFVLLSSLFVALALVPLLAIRFSASEPNKFERMQEVYTHRVQEWYRRWLTGVLENKGFQNRFLIGLVVTFIAIFLLPMSGLLKVTFFPQDNVDFVYIEIEKPQGTILSETDLTVRQVEEVLYGYADVASFATTVGQSSTFNQNGFSTDQKLGNITAILVDTESRSKTSTEIVADLEQKLQTISGAEIRVLEPSNGPPSGAPILVKIYGYDLANLEDAALSVEQAITSVSGTRNVINSTKANSIEFSIGIDTAKATELGLTPTRVGQILRASVYGITATTISEDGKDIDVVVKTALNPDYVDADDTIRTTLDSITSISVPTASGPVLLGSLITTDIAKANNSIRHEDKKRVVTVTSYVEADKNVQEVTAEIKKSLEELKLPAGVSVSFGGEDEEVQKSFRDMFFALIAGLVLMLAILVLEFNSFRFPIFLLTTVPLSLIGVFVGLTLFGKPLSFPSILGFIALSGVIINHSIILLDSMIHMIRNHPEYSLKKIVVESAVVRLRPIFLTTITTVVGVIPLSYASALWGPLAFSIMFGLAFAIILTLILVPILFYRYPGNLEDLRDEK